MFILFTVNVFPALENNLSLGVEVAEIHKYFFAKFDKIENLIYTYSTIQMD